MKTFELSTNLFPIMSVGMYTNQTCDSSKFIDDYMIDDDYENNHISYNSDIFWNNFDNDKYVAFIYKTATDYINNEIKPILINLGLGITDIIPAGIYSPKYYNFNTDTLNFDLITNDDFIDNIIYVIDNLLPNEYDDLSKFLKDNYSSYDGFISFTDNNIPDLIKSIQNNEEREIGAFLRWYWNWTNSNLECENWSYYINENCPMYDEFLTDEFINELNNVLNYIVEFTKNNYTNLNSTQMIDSICEYFSDDDEITHSMIKDSVLKTIKTIENNTMRLDI
jgi:hypothetical protein